MCFAAPDTRSIRLAGQASRLSWTGVFRNGTPVLPTIDRPLLPASDAAPEAEYSFPAGH